MDNILLQTSLIDADGVLLCFDVVQPSSKVNSYAEQRAWAEAEIEQLDACICSERSNIEDLSKSIDIYTADLDKWDKSLAVASGILSGIIDSFAVGKFDFQSARDLVGDDMQQEIINLAKKKGWKGVEKGPRKGEFPLDRAIAYLEDNFKTPSDSLKDVFGGSKQHHMRDFAHHHSPLGLFFSVLTQFTGKAYGTDTNGAFIMVDVPKEMIGTDVKRKWAIAVTDWTLHLASDMDGSNATAGFGCGIPGPIVSLIKVLSALPIFNKKNAKPGDNKLSLFAAKLYNGTLLAHKDENGRMTPVKIDLRGEKAIKHELGRQALPVVINEVFVRVYYLIRRLYTELSLTQIESWDDVAKLNWRRVAPVANRSIARMITIASGTFITVDLADAALRGAIASGGSPEKFAAEMLLRVNYVGLGRFAVAIVTDVHMGKKCDRLRSERIDIVQRLLMASNAKLLFNQEGMWIAAQTAEEAINELYESAYRVMPAIYTYADQLGKDFADIDLTMRGIEDNNPGLAKFILQKFNEN